MVEQTEQHGAWMRAAQERGLVRDDSPIARSLVRIAAMNEQLGAFRRDLAELAMRANAQHAAPGQPPPVETRSGAHVGLWSPLAAVTECAVAAARTLDPLAAELDQIEGAGELAAQLRRLAAWLRDPGAGPMGGG